MKIIALQVKNIYIFMEEKAFSLYLKKMWMVHFHLIPNDLIRC